LLLASKDKAVTQYEGIKTLNQANNSNYNPFAIPKKHNNTICTLGKASVFYPAEQKSLPNKRARMAQTTFYLVLL
jgi:hypothetical protein